MENQDQTDGVDDTQESQLEPTQDSELLTPQPDQPVPSEEERQEGSTGEVGPSGQPAEGTVTAPSYPTNEEQQAAHDQREQELEAQRREHNERTGGGEVREGELQAQRDEHNERTAGEQS